jgi:hypothetical protein
VFKCYLEDKTFAGESPELLYVVYSGQKVQSSFGFGGLIRSLSKRSISLVTSSGVLYSISGIPFRRSRKSLSACFPSANLMRSFLAAG